MISAGDLGRILHDCVARFWSGSLCCKWHITVLLLIYYHHHHHHCCYCYYYYDYDYDHYRYYNFLIYYCTTVDKKIPSPEGMLSRLGEFGMKKRESFLQFSNIQKKPFPSGHVKYLVPLNVPSEQEDLSCSYKTDNIKNLFAFFFKTKVCCRVVIEVRTLALSQCRFPVKRQHNKYILKPIY